MLDTRTRIFQKVYAGHFNDIQVKCYIKSFQKFGVFVSSGVVYQYNITG